jgi:hypothetical protein
MAPPGDLDGLSHAEPRQKRLQAQSYLQFHW